MDITLPGTLIRPEENNPFSATESLANQWRATRPQIIHLVGWLGQWKHLTQSLYLIWMSEQCSRESEVAIALGPMLRHTTLRKKRLERDGEVVFYEPNKLSREHNPVETRRVGLPFTQEEFSVLLSMLPFAIQFYAYADPVTHVYIFCKTWDETRDAHDVEFDRLETLESARALYNVPFSTVDPTRKKRISSSWKTRPQLEKAGV